MTNLETLTSYQKEIWVAVLLVAVVALMLRIVRHGERGALRIVWGISALSTVAMSLATHYQQHAEIAIGALATAIGLCGIAFLYLLVRGLFRFLLPMFGLGVPRIVGDLTLACLLLGWGLVLLRLGGLELSQLLTTSAVITAILAFSMQDTLGNVLGGVALQLDNSLSVGDWVHLDHVSGCVTDVHWRYARIETSSHELVVIPNSWLMRNRFTVSPRADGVSKSLSRSIHFNLESEVNPETIIRVLEKSLIDAEIANVLVYPGPKAVFCDASAGTCKYVLHYWLGDQHLAQTVDSVVRTHAFVALVRAGVRMRVNKDGSDSWRAAEEQKEFERRLRAISDTHLFAELSKQEQEVLASYLVHSPFATGDLIARQGDIGSSVYLIVCGQVDVYGDGPNGRSFIATLRGGDIFGEMSLLTGEPRSATVIAVAPTDCYQLNKTGLAQILDQRPEIAKQLTAIVEARNLPHGQFHKTADPISPDHNDLLGRVRKFFSMSTYKI